jgi:hypothetical protein
MTPPTPDEFETLFAARRILLRIANQYSDVSQRAVDAFSEGIASGTAEAAEHLVFQVMNIGHNHLGWDVEPVMKVRS